MFYIYGFFVSVLSFDFRLGKCYSFFRNYISRAGKGERKMKLGIIGTGNMAAAIMGGSIGKKMISAEEIIGADLFAPGREKGKEQFGIQVTEKNQEVVEKAEVIILSVKPQFMRTLLIKLRTA